MGLWGRVGARGSNNGGVGFALSVQWSGSCARHAPVGLLPAKLVPQDESCKQRPLG
jgi:hypothetical protein